MAYYTQDGKGPFPCDEGEYCGNHSPRRDEYEDDRPWLSRMREGMPHAVDTFTQEELMGMGFVGLYLKASRPLREGEVHAPTPESLKEPSLEVDYGQD